MHVAAHCSIRYRDEGLADEHVPQADSEKEAIPIQALGAKCRKMKWICDKGIGEDRHSLVNPIGRIFLNPNHHLFLKKRRN